MLNITNRTPLAGVRLFESSTYPDSVDLYWRDHSPIAFELSDNPDRGQMYHNFLAHIAAKVSIHQVQYFEHDESHLTIAELKLEGRSFWAVMDYDILTLHRERPILPEVYTEDPEMLCNYMVDMFSINVTEGLLAVSFSPVDLAWLCGDVGNSIGFYEESIWRAAVRRLPEDLFFSPHWDDCGCLDAAEVVRNDVHPCCAQ